MVKVLNPANNLSRNIWFLFFLFFALILFILHYCGFCFYEEYEGYSPSFYSGRCTGGQPIDIFSSVFLGWGSLLLACYRQWPCFYWYDLFFNIALCFSSTIISSVVFVLLREKFNVRISVLFTLSFIAVFLVPDFISQQYTRVSLLLCISSFALLTLNAVKGKKVYDILGFCFFALGAMLRYESGLLVLGLAFCYFLAKGFFGEKRYLKPSLLMIFAILPVLIYLNFLIPHDNDFSNPIKPSDEFRIAKGHIVPIGDMKTARDSILYRALQNGVLNDPHHIDPLLVGRIVLPGVPLHSELLVQAWIDLWASLLQIKIPAVVCLFFIVVTIFFANKKRKRFTIIFTCLLFGLCMYAVSYFLKMETRVLEPILTMLIICLLFFLTDQESTGISEIFSLFSSAVILLLGICYVTGMIEYYQARTMMRAQSISRLKRASTDKILVADTYTFMTIFYDNFRPFRDYDFDWAEDIIYIDIEAYSLSPGYQRFLQSKCGCDPSFLSNLFVYFHDKRDHIVFAANPERLDFFAKYMEGIYGQKYTFVRSGLIFEPDAVEKIKDHRLNIVTDPIYLYQMGD